MSESTVEKVRVPQVAANGATAGAIRTWAQLNGVEVGSRGKLAADVVEKYNEANPA